ncbi:hypothetical protein OEZ85_004143 [Tetradesmus obliquus]|uniref:O-fucosyltransferase family protein n=1 Tax=Tetradesmus obliquus TaxID=3088 RepID=A0ABY8UEQ8_TETOB|nr:hypothetical protein OEZ85_004143 [Tetradesmus obliquus]
MPLAIARYLHQDPQCPCNCTTAPAAAAAANSSSSSSAWPKSPHSAVFDDPWAKANIALTYAHQLKDGVGAQTMRMLEIYALANSIGIGYLHRPITCVGHVGELVHYREAACNLTREADVRLLAKIRRMISLPSTVSEDQVRGWQQVYVSEFTWWKFAALAGEARRKQQPTLFVTEFATSVAHAYPGVFLSVPAFRPDHPETRLVCQRPSAGAGLQPGKPWLLNALRLAIHVRRGDIATNSRWSHRMFPPAYYVHLAQQITQVLDEAGCDFSVEVYTEAPSSAAGRAELEQLRQAIPHAVMQVSKDMVWSWQQMATADVLVMSNSAFSISAALLNPNAFNVFFPGAQLHQSRVEMSHWHTPLDRNGTLPSAALQALKRRVGHPGATDGGFGSEEMDIFGRPLPF